MASAEKALFDLLYLAPGLNQSTHRTAGTGFRRAPVMALSGSRRSFSRCFQNNRRDVEFIHHSIELRHFGAQQRIQGFATRPGIRAITLCYILLYNIILLYNL